MGEDELQEGRDGAALADGKDIFNFKNIMSDNNKNCVHCGRDISERNPDCAACSSIPARCEFGCEHIEWKSPAPQEEARGVRERFIEKFSYSLSDGSPSGRIHPDLDRGDGGLVPLILSFIEAEVERAQDTLIIKFAKDLTKAQELARTTLLDELEKEIEGEYRNAENGFLGTDNEDEAHNAALDEVKTLLTKLRGK